MLYTCVLVNMGYDLKQSLGRFLATAKDIKAPTFEGVTRCRRHIQELMPELKDIDTDTARLREIPKYREYNLSGLEE